MERLTPNCAATSTGLVAKLWLDGTDGQEAELDDVKSGVLDAPTDDEGPGEIIESNKGEVALEGEDEKAAVPGPDSSDELKDFPGFK